MIEVFHSSFDFKLSNFKTLSYYNKCKAVPLWINQWLEHTKDMSFTSYSAPSFLNHFRYLNEFICSSSPLYKTQTSILT